MCDSMFVFLMLLATGYLVTPATAQDGAQEVRLDQHCRKYALIESFGTLLPPEILTLSKSWHSIRLNGAQMNFSPRVTAPSDTSIYMMN